MIRIDPSDALRPFVRAFEVIETDEPAERVLVPDTGLVVGFRYAGSAAQLEGRSIVAMPSHVVTGLRVTARRMRTSRGGGMVVAKLREGGAAAFFATPLHELFGNSVALADLVGPGRVEPTASRIEAARTHRERVVAFEEFLLSLRARVAFREDALVSSAIRRILTDPTSVRVGRIARELGVSIDMLEKRFRRIAGASPKQLASIVRLRRAVESHRRGKPLTRLALESGYYDHAHFTRSFSAATGSPPSRFFDAKSHCL